MKDIVVSFDDKSKEIIDNMDSIKDFKNNLDEREKLVDNFNVNNNILKKLLHPVKLVKNYKESKRIKRIRNTFNNMYYTSVLSYVTEETGDLQVDLDNAAYKVKPAYIDNYVKSLKLKK